MGIFMLAQTTQPVTDPGLLQVFFWWCLTQVVGIVDVLVVFLQKGLPSGWSANISVLFTWLAKANYWFPIAETLAMLGVFFAFITIFFLIKVIAYLF